MNQPYRIPDPPPAKPKDKFLKRNPGLIGGAAIALIIATLYLLGSMLLYIFPTYLGTITNPASVVVGTIFGGFGVAIVLLIMVVAIGLVSILATEFGSSIYKYFEEKNSK